MDDAVQLGRHGAGDLAAGSGSSRRTAAIVAEGESRAKAFRPVTIS